MQTGNRITRGPDYSLLPGDTSEVFSCCETSDKTPGTRMGSMCMCAGALEASAAVTDGERWGESHCPG